MKDMWTNIIRLIKQRLAGISGIAEGLTGLTQAAAPLLVVLVITVISFLGVNIFYKLVALQLAHHQNTGVRQNPAMALSAKPGHRVEYYQVIADRNLFQTTRQAIVDKSGENLLPSEEYTAFDLKGTIAIGPFAGYAIVEEKGKGNQKLYRVGEMIGQARLVRITRNTAVLQSGGRELLMKVREIAQGPQSGRLNRSESGLAVSRQQVTESLADLKSVMSQAVVRPYLVEGAPSGFVVTNIVPGSLYQKLGLQNGDVVIDVNNKKLVGADDIFELVNIMQAGGAVSVNLLRNGQNEMINYSFH